jgi:hypothetical protein
MAELTPIEIVRLNITDLSDAPLFSDDQINAWLTQYDGNINRATYRALVTIATSTVLMSKKLRTQDLSTDGPAESTALLALAKTYKDEADQADADGDSFFEIIPFGGSSRSEAEEWRL